MSGNWKLIVFLLLIVPAQAVAYEVLLGIESGSKLVGVEELALGDEEIALLESDMSFGPAASVRTRAHYFSVESQWGYHWQLDGAIIDITKQDIGELDPVDLGTSVKGYALYAMPVAFYHFKKGRSNQWQFKAGLGAGLGYMDLSGTFRITDTTHPEFDQIKSVNTAGIGFSVGIYFEASYKRHLIVGQNYGPVIDDGTYEYQQHNILLSYRYLFDFMQ